MGATTPTSTLGMTSCGTAVWASTSSVLCMQPAGEGLNKELRATVEGIVGSRTALFSYDGVLGAVRAFSWGSERDSVGFPVAQLPLSALWTARTGRLRPATV
jgi:hypothetical protein